MIKKLLFIEPQVISQLTERAFADVSHLLRSSHLKQLSLILNDNEASENDKFVALEMIKNANISSAGVLPMCQDTGTAIVLGYKGENIFTGVDDSKLISQGIYDTYQTKNLRYSQVAPLSMFDEVNTNNNRHSKRILASRRLGGFWEAGNGLQDCRIGRGRIT
jgi:fumarate hydratase class I